MGAGRQETDRRRLAWRSRRGGSSRAHRARGLRSKEFTIDDPGPNEVLVRILASGVCHTDLARQDRASIGTSGFPFLLGHEGAGIVEAVGAGRHQPAGRATT
ncbi:MAG: alcohol dehydrogenase catalytic domain-containing protein [Baekduia sp.]